MPTSTTVTTSDTPLPNCGTCGSPKTGVWISSSVKRQKFYCKMCHAVRRRTYWARKKANGGRHTEKQWQELLLATPQCPGCKCIWAEIPPRPSSRYRTIWTKDHVVPVTRGGTNEITNIQPLCYPCNFRKGARSNSEFVHDAVTE